MGNPDGLSGQVPLELGTFPYEERVFIKARSKQSDIRMLLFGSNREQIKTNEKQKGKESTCSLIRSKNDTNWENTKLERNQTLTNLEMVIFLLC